MDDYRTPLADRTAAAVQAKAEDLRRMAATATTRDTRNALNRLADRYEALAEPQESASTSQWRAEKRDACRPRAL